MHGGSPGTHIGKCLCIIRVKRTFPQQRDMEGIGVTLARSSPIFMGVSGLAIRTPIFAAAIRIQTRAERDVRAVIIADDALRKIA